MFLYDSYEQKFRVLCRIVILNCKHFKIIFLISKMHVKLSPKIIHLVFFICF